MGSEWEDSFKAVFGNRGRLRIGSVGDGGISDGSQERGVQSTESIELTKLPDVSNRYWEPIEEAAPEIAVDGLCSGDAVLDAENNYQFLAKLRTKALIKINEILDLPLPHRDDSDYIRMASIQKDAATNIVSASLKADENCFRRRNNDALARLYAAVENELAKSQAAPITIDNTITHH